ncbi:hypothetical protein M8818_003251 [Zalaria obscura]|uniref:Uncharacterized protein n=1 Tax=Zalaria obscura TaxID=2024903 RepID=A0ACC3SFG6_9PEZI
MPIQLLPASAAAFAPRSQPNIVLNTKVEPWLTQTLKRINKIKRPLNSVPQHFRCLTETLGGPSAIWTLASLMFNKAPADELRKDSNPLVEALYNHQVIHIEAYVVHVDMVSQNEVAFKLTSETIDALIEYHKDIYSPDLATSTYSWPEKDSQLKTIQEEFVQAVNRFVFRTGVRALEGLEEDGAGELLDGRSGDVKNAIMNMFLPLLPPPPRIVDVIHPAPIAQNHVMTGNWWQPTQLLAPHPHPVDSWRVLPSTPSPTTTSCSDQHSNTFWSSMGLDAVQLPSPTPSFSQPAYSSASQFYSSPQAVSALPSLQLPSASLPQHCGTSMTNSGFDDFGWSYTSFTPQYATI